MFSLSGDVGGSWDWGVRDGTDSKITEILLEWFLVNLTIFTLQHYFDNWLQCWFLPNLTWFSIFLQFVLFIKFFIFLTLWTLLNRTLLPYLSIFDTRLFCFYQVADYPTFPLHYLTNSHTRTVFVSVTSWYCTFDYVSPKQDQKSTDAIGSAWRCCQCWSSDSL